MIHKTILVFAFCLPFIIINSGTIYAQNSNNEIVNNEPRSTNELLDLWDKVNTAELNVKDPFTIDVWEQLVLKQ